MGQEFKQIKTELIDPPSNPVRVSAAEESIDDLARSIKEHGLIQPITVFPVNGRFETLVGDRRQRACKLAGLETTPCIVVDDPSTLSQVIRLTENIQRVDMSPIEEGAIVSELREINNWGWRPLAAHLGKSVQWCKDRCEMMALPADVQLLIHHRLIGMKHGQLLGRITEESTRKEYAQEVMNQGTSWKTLEMWVELWEHSRQSPGYDLTGGPDPKTLPQHTPHKMRCQLCEGYYEVRQLISIIACRGCVEIIQNIKSGVTDAGRDTDPGGGDSHPGMGDTGGAPSHKD